MLTHAPDRRAEEDRRQLLQEPQVRLAALVDAVERARERGVGAQQLVAVDELARAQVGHLQIVVRQRVAQVPDREPAVGDRVVEQLVDHLLLRDLLGQRARPELHAVERRLDLGAQLRAHVGLGVLDHLVHGRRERLALVAAPERDLGDLVRRGVQVLGDADLARRRQRAQHRLLAARQRPADDVDDLLLALGDHARLLQVVEQARAGLEPQHALLRGVARDRHQRGGPALRRGAVERARQPRRELLEIAPRGVDVAGAQAQDRRARPVAALARQVRAVAGGRLDDDAPRRRARGPGGDDRRRRRVGHHRLLGRARRPRRREQRRRVDVERDRRRDRLALIREGRERARQRRRRERRQLEVERDELDVGLRVVGGREQQVLLPQHEPDLVELGLADAVDALADRRAGERALREQRVERLVYARVKDRAPRRGHRVRPRRRERRPRPGERDHALGQRRRIGRELAALDQPHEVAPRAARSWSRAAPAARSRGAGDGA